MKLWEMAFIVCDFKQETAYEMLISDWSSDVGSSDLEYRYSWGRQNWFDHAAAEHKAVREGVGLFDLTSLAKFRVEGRDAEAVLQRISANDVAVAPGRIVYTQWLNDRGGIEADLTVTRLSETAFLVVKIGRASCRERGCQSV